MLCDVLQKMGKMHASHQETDFRFSVNFDQ